MFKEPTTRNDFFACSRVSGTEQSRHRTAEVKCNFARHLTSSDRLDADIVHAYIEKERERETHDTS